MKKHLLTLLAAGALGAASSHGAMILVDDFESGLNGWTTGTQGQLTTVIDPAGGNNTVGSVEATVANTGFFASIALPNELPNGESGTLFFRFYAENGALSSGFNHAFGLADVSNPTLFGDYEVTQQVFGTTPDNRVRNGSTYDDVGDVTQGQWYNVWLVAKNVDGSTGNLDGVFDGGTDRYDLYVNTGSGAATSGDQVATDAAFRNLTASPLETVFIKLGSTIDLNLSVYYDDIYFDADGQNLANPVPEPSTYALLAGLATLAVIMYRRRR